MGGAMKVLVIGSGGREHALVWKIAKSPEVKEVFCAPGNAGIAQSATCVPIQVTDIEGLCAFALKEGVDLTVVGPELPLTLGVSDTFERRGLAVCGCSQAAATLEGSKIFAKELMDKCGVPTARYRIFDSAAEAKTYAEKVGAPVVVKADGLAAGKGVMPCMTIKEAVQAIDVIMSQKAFGTAGDRVVIEEFLTGEEASFLAFTDGEHVIPLPTSQDHKAIFDGDKGPNTGGMGAYSPAPVITPALHGSIVDTVMVPTIRAMANEGKPYKGILYAGLMIKDGMPKVLEFNARFGDPEAQPLLVRMKGDLIGPLMAIATGSLSRVSVEWDSRASVCVVMASEGYPGSYQKGKEIRGLENVEKIEGVTVFHAGTALRNNRIVTSGGRVLGVTALGQTIGDAIDRAYAATAEIGWAGAYFRKDIGRKALVRNSES
jgi:phosphoribosylamine--glycine ligase